MSYKLLKEILGFPAAPFEWLDNERCVFSIEDQSYGIFVSYMGLMEDKYSVVNISFGRISTNNFTSEHDLDITLSGAGKPRQVLSTVGAACLANQKIKAADIICLAATDEHSARRSPIYSIVASEIRQFTPGFGGTSISTVQTQTGSLLTLMVKTTISEEDRDIAVRKLELTKVR